MYENLSFRFYQPEELYIDSIDSRLDQDEKKIRRFIMNRIIGQGRPYNLEEELEEASSECGLDPGQVEGIYKILEDKGVIVPDGEQNVNFVYPVSAIPTNHRVSLADGRVFTAMCAIDSMGSHFTFKQDIRIDSACSNTGEPIYVELKDGELVDYSPQDLHILHVDLNKNNDWSGDCWNIMNFFCTKDDYDEWVGKMNLEGEDIFCLDAEEALSVAKMLFSVTDI